GAGRDAREQRGRTGAVAASGLEHEAAGERGAELVGLDRAALLELLDDRQRHRGVVGPPPRALHRDQPLRGAPRELAAVALEHVAERVADGEPEETDARGFDRLHRLWIAS